MLRGAMAHDFPIPVIGGGFWFKRRLGRSHGSIKRVVVSLKRDQQVIGTGVNSPGQQTRFLQQAEVVCRGHDRRGLFHAGQLGERG